MNARQRRRTLRAWLRAVLPLLSAMPPHRWPSSPWALSAEPLRVNVAGWARRHSLLPRDPK